MANCVKCRFSLNLQLFSVVSKSAPVKYIATYCLWNPHQIHSSCTSMSLWWQNNPSLWLSWTVSIPKWVSIIWQAACAPSDAKLLEGGVSTFDKRSNSQWQNAVNGGCLFCSSLIRHTCINLFSNDVDIRTMWCHTHTKLSEIPQSAHICYVVKFRGFMAMSVKVSFKKCIDPKERRVRK